MNSEGKHMTVKTFDEYKRAASREPFAFPMPDGEPVMIAQPTIDLEHEAFKAANAAGAAGKTHAEALLAGLAVYVSDEDGQRIADAYGQLPPTVLAAVVSDMREHFGQDKAQG